MFEEYKTPNDITKRLARAQLYQDYKLKCLNYYVYKGKLPNMVAKQKIMRGLCKDYGVDPMWAEKPLIDNKLSRYEKVCFSIGTFDLNTITDHNI